MKSSRRKKPKPTVVSTKPPAKQGHGQRQPPVAPADSQRRAHQYAVQARALVPVQLAQLRGQLGLSRYAWAKRSGVSEQHLGDLESGEHGPSYFILCQLAASVTMTVVELVGHLHRAGRSCSGKP